MSASGFDRHSRVGGASDSVAVSAGEFHKEPRQIGRPGAACSKSIHAPAPTGGIGKMPNGTHGSARPLPASPVTSAFGRMSGPALPPGSCLGRYHTDRQPGDALQNTAK
jgi:hypothetical protein